MADTQQSLPISAPVVPTTTATIRRCVRRALQVLHPCVVTGWIPRLLVWGLIPGGLGFSMFETRRMRVPNPLKRCVWVSNCLKPVGSGFQTKWPVFGRLPGYPGYPGTRVYALIHVSDCVATEGMRHSPVSSSSREACLWAPGKRVGGRYVDWETWRLPAAQIGGCQHGCCMSVS